MKETGFVLFGIYILLTGWLLFNAFVQCRLWRHANRQRKKEPLKAWQGKFPFVSIQVPVYNEKYVVEGLLDALAGLDYPRSCFEIMVLDDSTDETTQLVRRKAAQLASHGFNIEVIQRGDRRGYKAGALQANLAQCRGDLIAIFDADFRPSTDFLHSLLPHFADPAVGLVQARWGHLNREENFLTRIQSYLLDTYFTVEQAGRQAAGYFINFCGTAGIWRKSCIVDAGGWDGDILSEDLDLSYRAQLRGWKIVYDATTEVPAELPAEVEAFKIQQARWTKGIMQVCRKNGRRVAAAQLPWRTKLHAFFHLSSSFVFPCLFINALLSLPLLLLRHQYPEFILLTNIAAIGGLNLILLTTIFFRGVRSAGGDRQFTWYYPVFLVVYMALSVQNTVAVLQGLLGYRSAFIRTPKFAANKVALSSYLSRNKKSTHFLELLMLLYFMMGIGLSFYFSDHFFLLLFVMMSCGLAILVFRSVVWRSWRLPLSLPKLRLRRLLFLSHYE